MFHRSETEEWLTEKETAPPEHLVKDSTQLLNFGLVAPTRLPRHLPPSHLPVPPPSRSIRDPPTQGRAVAMVPHPKTRRLRHQRVMTKLIRTVLVQALGARTVSHHYNDDNCCCPGAISTNRISICGKNDLKMTNDIDTHALLTCMKLISLRSPVVCWPWPFSARRFFFLHQNNIIDLHNDRGVMLKNKTSDDSLSFF